MINKQDFNERLIELSMLENGWLDGSGNKITTAAMDFTKQFINDIDNRNFPYPLAFPEYEGGIILEWFNHSIGISIEIDNDAKNITLSACGFINKKDLNCVLTIEDINQIKNELNICLDIYKNSH